MAVQDGGRWSVHDDSILFYIDDAETGTPLAARKEDIVLWQKATGKGGIKNVAKLVADKHRDKVTYKAHPSKVELTAEAAEAKFVEALRCSSRRVEAGNCGQDPGA